MRACLKKLTIFGLLLMGNVAIAQETPCGGDSNRHTYKEWVKRVGLDFGKAYYASSTRVKQIKENYSKLQIGMKREEVEKLLAAPDFEDPGISRTYSEKRRWCGYQWGYYVSKTDINQAAMDDEGVFLSFDSSGKLTWAAPQNLKGLKQKGSP